MANMSEPNMAQTKAILEQKNKNEQAHNCEENALAKNGQTRHGKACKNAKLAKLKKTIKQKKTKRKLANKTEMAKWAIRTLQNLQKCKTRKIQKDNLAQKIRN